ncbi:hypothetical protein A2574_03185 [Candidatus Shapirobacteria bacterium RIFOXYD1_FULL_38_32]|uniref:Uncharacterized protein n=3 Tax=Candidatus Shapironibacteriota TaxID=1752721 RepID=A0A0G0JU27_9BACT|nr:MAG: hypothetical protein US90_C0008G0044 [Candidatus Shapirobacteria bacterium GW2011_GWE2_38_30]KKQ89363.1 MAG: hypothetical protein UT14_C0060G0007 [Candidatus Shapirobacteria bacterium GW2011_GWE1_38_92]OGL55921.1 MAG: hypothetical protein A2367_01990 [Candidatus Shapirobacteria bacterium RIFOXYB1_FULL_38_38]OGL56563.1 MAG: hypothetical protein A2195_00645 [Candidatus Shapirobacteria bacterium RIFOXYA1_FULL_39_17]OGL56681.1 MAG: hypothetical protein A2410_01405 [Candidatus Shapirobacteri
MSPVKWRKETNLEPDNPAINDRATVISVTKGTIYDGVEPFIMNEGDGPQKSIRVNVNGGSGQVTITPEEGGPGQPFEHQLKIGEELIISYTPRNQIKLKRTRR